jgi:omega-6 fatty acid desaturase (delta-12 desaturase)
MLEETAGGARECASATSEASRFKRLAEHCRSYKGAVIHRSIIQLSVTLALFFTTVSLMLAAFYHQMYWAMALLSLPAAGFVIRIFIMQHDCGHQSFFKGRLANDITGRIISVFTFIPYDIWKLGHNMHHANCGNLEKRGTGDVSTLTVKEFEALQPFKKFVYRVYRHPLTLLVFGPPVYILLLLRLPPLNITPQTENFKNMPPSRAWRSVMALNLSLAAVYGTACYFLGWQAVLAVYLPIIVIAFGFGQWLFYMQHQYEDTYWQHNDKWNYNEAALLGSSYYALPKVLQWFTGNIGFHHIHHLCPNIPNYKLEECFKAEKELAGFRRITMLESLKSVNLALWDEERFKLISFREWKRNRTAAAVA